MVNYIEPNKMSMHLVNEFLNSYTNFDMAKAYAKIAVNTHFYNENNSPFDSIEEWIKDEIYWKNVIDEINKI